MEPTTDLLDLSAVAVDALERALAENPAAEAPRAELERRASIDGEAGTDARTALTRLDEARPPVAAVVAEVDTGAPMPPAVPHVSAGTATVRLEVRQDPAAQAILRYFGRRDRLQALEVRDTQAARTAKLELELGEALDAIMEVAQALNIEVAR